MTSLPQNETIVVDVAGNRCAVLTDVPAHAQVLQATGFVKQGDQWTRQISDDADRQNLVKMLIDLKALFSAGRDWSPEELVEHYRESGAITTAYRSISWLNPDQYLIVDHV